MEKIDMAFHWFLEHNPTIEIICDEETMTQWYDFVKWSYTNNLLAVEEWSEGDTVTEGSYTFKISSLMESVVEECVDWYDNTRAEEEARLLTSNLLHARASEVSAKVCDECDGDDYYCKKCYGTGFNVYDKDIDWVHYDEAYRPGVYTWDDIKYDEIHWLHYEEALSKIFNSVDISSFEKLSKINLSKEEKNEEFLKRTKIAAISLKTAINFNDSAWGKMEAGNYNEALKNVLESIELISYSDNNDTAAMIYFHLQDFEKGLEYSNESIKINETNSEHFYNRAQILVKLDKKDLAIKDLNKAIDLDGFEDAKKLLEQIT
jgi:tetratricopeptide (TPR) repeat protein